MSFTPGLRVLRSAPVGCNWLSKRSRWRALAAATVLAALCAACGSSRPATKASTATASGRGSATSTSSIPRTATVVLGEPLSPPLVPQQAPYVAQKEGFFAREGLHVKIVYMPNGLQSELGTTSGSIRFGMAAGSDSIEAAAQGAPIHAVWVDYAPLDLVCIGGPHITSVKDLVGKSVGSTGAGGFAQTTTTACLSSGGVKVSQVKEIDMTRAQFIPALATGRISAAVFHADEAYTVLHQIKGATVLAPLYKTLPLYWYGSLNVRDAYASAHPGVTERMLAALILADRWMMNSANNAKFISLAAASTHESAKALQYAIKFDRSIHLWNTNCSINQKSVSFTTQLLLSQKVISRAPSFGQVVNLKYCRVALKLLSTAG